MDRRELRRVEHQGAEERANFRRRFRRLWRGKLPFDVICERLDVEPGEAMEIAESLGLGERNAPDVYYPTPEEIRLKAAAMKGKWTPDERDYRLRGASVEQILERWEKFEDERLKSSGEDPDSDTIGD